jgi:hypothetical protein
MIMISYKVKHHLIKELNFSKNEQFFVETYKTNKLLRMRPLDV